MKLIDGLWWPDTDETARPAITWDSRISIPKVCTYVKDFNCVIQAGGNVGVYPIALATYFDRVLSFEPDYANYECLERNVGLNPKIQIERAALGADIGTCRIEIVEENNCGAHKIVQGGDTPVLTIDDLGLSHCDLIWLDIEGHEAKAIDGARATIEKFSPIIVLEEKGLGDLASLPGYRRLDRIGNDTVYWRG